MSDKAIREMNERQAGMFQGELTMLGSLEERLIVAQSTVQDNNEERIQAHLLLKESWKEGGEAPSR